jgi:hypothetical protein
MNHAESPAETTARFWDNSPCDHDTHGRGARAMGGRYCLGCGLPEKRDAAAMTEEDRP